MKQTLNISEFKLLGGDAWLLRLKGQNDDAAAKAFANQMQDGKQYAVVIGEVTKKRSLDANAYCWVLLGKLAEKLSQNSEKPITAVEIYRSLILEIPGVYEVVQCAEAAAPTLVSLWESKGIGWQAVKVDAAYIPGQTIMQLYKGSSEYDRKQMAILLGMVIQECQQQGIPTATPEEIAKMKGLVEDEATS